MRVALFVRRIVLSVVLLVTLVAVPRTALAQDNDTTPIKPEAKVRFARGLEYYKMKEFEAAIAEFEAAYALDPRKEIMFAQAQAERLSGDCASAVTLYRRFLAMDPPAVHAEAARASLDKCEVALSSHPEGGGVKPRPDSGPPPSATVPEVTPRPAPAPPPESGAPAATHAPVTVVSPARPAERPFWKDGLGDTLAGAGVVALGVGIGFYVASASDATAADDATLQSEHARLLDRAETRRTIAVVGVAAGSALLVGAAVRWLWPRADERTQVALDAGQGGATLVVAGSF